MDPTQPVYLDLSSGAIRMLAGQLAPAAEAAARTMRDAIVDTMEPGPARTGRRYYIPGTRTEYTASAPGEPPAVREGEYRDSWQTTPAVISHQTVMATVFSDRVVVSENGNRWLLGLLLDRGTDRMRPRPHLDAGVKLGKFRALKVLRGAA